MKYKLLKEVIDLVDEFENQNQSLQYSMDGKGFKNWILDQQEQQFNLEKFEYEGKANGRSLDSVISTHLVHLSKFAKLYSKAAIHQSKFSSQEDFIFLITLKTFGTMSKMDLIRRNIQDKPTGIQVINRLIAQGFIHQTADAKDKRIKLISISEKGIEELDQQMGLIRQATQIVAGKLEQKEKLQLIYLLNKLENFHLPIYHQNLDQDKLLGFALDSLSNID